MRETLVFVFKQKTAYEVRISDWSSDVCSSDLGGGAEHGGDIVVAFDIGLLREVQITAIGLRLASEGGLQVIFGLGAFERHGKPPDVGKMAPGGCRGPTDRKSTPLNSRH